MNPKARLEHGFIWTCPNCECDNHAYAEIAELSPYEQIELREEHGVEDSQTGDFVRCPTSVRCASCGMKFEAEPPE